MKLNASNTLGTRTRERLLQDLEKLLEEEGEEWVRNSQVRLLEPLNRLQVFKVRQYESEARENGRGLWKE